MPTIEGYYYGGQRSQSERATVSFVDAQTVSIRTETESISVPADSLSISDKIGSIPRKLTWGEPAYVMSEDNAALAEFVAELKHTNGSLVSWLERNFAVASVALVTVFAAVFCIVVFGIPKAAHFIAHKLPDEVYASNSEPVLAQLDSLYLSTSTLTIERQESLRRYFTDNGTDKFDIHFRNMDGIPNAFSMLGGDIVFTDALVNIAESDEELLAVYFHELGHSQERHAEQMLLQQSSWAILLIFITGDISGVSDILLTIPLALNQMSFSRKFEREADDIAFEALVTNGNNTKAFADILTRISSHEFISSDEDYIASECDYSDEENETFSDNITETTTAEAKVQEAEVTEETVAQEQEAEEIDDDTDATEASQWYRVFDYLSTHPPTEERIKRFEAHQHTETVTQLPANLEHADE